MGKPSYQELINEVLRLKMIIASLSFDERYHVTKRQAVDLEKLRHARAVIVLIFPPNTREERIKRLLRTRYGGNILERVIYNDQTFLLFSDADDAGIDTYLANLRESAAKAGVMKMKAFSFAYQALQNANTHQDLDNIVRTAQSIEVARDNGYQY